MTLSDLFIDDNLDLDTELFGGKDDGAKELLKRYNSIYTYLRITKRWQPVQFNFFFKELFKYDNETLLQMFPTYKIEYIDKLRQAVKGGKGIELANILIEKIENA